MRIAIVGAGISGLVCAHLLHEDHELTVFEANDYAGGHTHTVRVDTADETHHVDTGFIVHNDRNYPRFERLLESVGVATQPAPMSFSVSDGRGGLEYNGSSANGLFANRANLVSPSFHRMVRDLLRFNREAPALVGLNGSGTEPRRVPRRRRLLARVRGPAAGAPGVGGVVGGPGLDVGVPGQPARGVLRQPRDVRVHRPAGAGGRSPAARRATWSA